jgi:hypothetical protein
MSGSVDRAAKVTPNSIGNEFGFPYVSVASYTMRHTQGSLNTYVYNTVGVDPRRS